MTINRRRFLALPAIGVPAMVVGKRLGILEWLKSSFFALRGASPIEHARFARELHDEIMPSLIAVEMQMDVLRRQLLAQANPLASELGRSQGLIREEWLRLRGLM